MINFAEYQRLFVVDSFSCPANCRVVVTMRHPDTKHWVFGLVRSPLDINFGDIVYGKLDNMGHFVDDTFYLYRGPHLAYHMICDEIPEELMTKLVSESPGVTMRSEDDGPIETY